MIEMVIWLVVIAAFVFRALKKNGTLDELFAGAKKRKENKAERVVYEQPEEGSGKKEKKKNGGRDFILMQAICIIWWLYSNGKKMESG